MKKRKLPTFLYVGSAKCGSTWLFEALRAHPEVFVPIAKDIYFFDKYYDKGLDWYASFFTKTDTRVKAMGELSHDYLYSRSAVKRIASDLPDVKLLACIRNPIERAFSVYLYRKRNGTAGADFDSTIKKTPFVIERGKYYEYILMYRELFGEDRFKVFLFDDLKKNSFEFAREVYKFLEVDSSFEYSAASKKVLPASTARIIGISRLVKKGANKLRQLGYANLIGRVKKSSFTRLLYKPIETKEKESLTGTQRAFLIDYYREDVTKLGKLLGQDLSHWLQ